MHVDVDLTGDEDASAAIHVSERVVSRECSQQARRGRKKMEREEKEKKSKRVE